MALSAADRKSLLRELNEYGAVLYYLVNKKNDDGGRNRKRII